MNNKKWVKIRICFKFNKKGKEWKIDKYLLLIIGFVFIYLIYCFRLFFFFWVKGVRKKLIRVGGGVNEIVSLFLLVVRCFFLGNSMTKYNLVNLSAFCNEI